MLEHIDKHGNPISGDEFMLLWGDGDYRRVASDIIDGQHVSTVWLGITHGDDSQGRPLVFETMAFGDGQYADQTWRYATLDEAQKGHTKICEVIWNETKPKKAIPKPNLVVRVGAGVMRGLKRG